MPGRASVGHDSNPSQELARFRSDLSYVFPIGDISEIKSQDTEEGRTQPDEVTVNFLGIATPNSFGSLPTPYVEEIRAQERDKNYAMRDFLDLFNHRLVSLFYRTWERSRVEVLYEAPEPSPFESALRAIAGIEGEVHEKRLPFDTTQMLSRSGLLAMRPASTSAIEGLVESLFGIPARVEQFLPSWYEMNAEDQTRLGRANSVLGEDATLGSETCLAQWRFRVRLGPMGYDTYRLLLPESDAFNTLSSMLRLATGPEFDFELTLVLDKDEIPTMQLGTGDASLDDATATEPCRLGWSTWLKHGDFDRDRDDAVFTPSLAREEARDSMEKRP
jgi:type VI secretion system protein ImpH